MKIVLVAQVVLGAFLLCGCPGAPASDPTGGSSTCAPGTKCSSSGDSSTGDMTSSASSTSATGTGGNGTAGAGGNGSGGAANGSGGAGGAGSSAGGSGGGANNKECDPLLNDISTKETSALTCTKETGANQCQQVIQGLCCPIGVQDMNSPEVQAYLEAIKKYLDSGCMPMCPPDPCPPTSKMTCITMGGAMTGSCGLP